MPYDPACDICTATKRPNNAHVQSHEDGRNIPLLVADYAFIKDSADSDNVTLLVMKLYPFKMFFACVVSSKGPDPLVVARISKWITDSGLTHFAYRSDKEPAIVAMLQQACAMAGRNGVLIKEDANEDQVGSGPNAIDMAKVAVPEHTHPG